MARVDRNVLRLGTWELANRPDVPRAVILDEAVELAKAFGTDESSAFVNGVLNRVADTLGRRGRARLRTGLRGARGMDIRFLAPELRCLDEASVELCACTIWSDERPVRGLAGLLDWRLGGQAERAARLGLRDG